MRLAITGATGFLGKRLITQLKHQGDDVRILTRRPEGQADAFEWEPLAGPPPAAALAGAGAVIHLAGEPVAQRWTAESKRAIRESRVIGTRNLVEALAAMSPRPEALVCASAIGFYGDRGDEVLTEASAAGTGFLPEVCAEWEQAAELATGLGIRVVRLRIGIALGAEGGALKQMLPPFRAGVGGPLAGGRMWMSWIHAEDLVRLISFAAKETMLVGPVNATAPTPVTNAGFAAGLGSALRRPAFFPVPGFALRLLYGEMAEVILSSARVLPRAAEAAGFRFLHPELLPALRGLL